MAYSELFKSFARIRDYMRDFYVYGFKSRDEFTKKSARSYDDERRRVESILGEYMGFKQTPEGKNVFISIDSRVSRHNPLYKAWKAKSFTDGDITLHFILFDILNSPDVCLTLSEILDRTDSYTECFSEPRTFDESTVRKKLSEYVSEGVIVAEKRGRALYYRRSGDCPELSADMLDFFSEVSPCGVIGSYLLDKTDGHEDIFTFKHHYMTAALDSETVCGLLCAIREKRSVMLDAVSKRRGTPFRIPAVPLRIMISAQSGRQYLMAFVPHYKRIKSFRTDNILSVEPLDVYPDFDKMRQKLDGMAAHTWGVSAQSDSRARIEHVEFTVRYGPEEGHIHKRLEREKRCGTVERISESESRFSADVYDSSELMPWMRTFICRITDLKMSNKALEKRFKSDIEEMYALYGLEGGEEE
ncbi:MAG: WYL domain-containing protein [Clostridia bacterium]|nr:WYL domain-containing protein [Clostridia bacterium]